ncbi:hypothetical protein O6H91_05G089000 [Diphasiastrum complanatum]|nr:hypothetical protein O6H91_05G089000 [Diphasiastrum complanatum]
MEENNTDGSYVNKMCSEGRLQEAVLALEHMEQQGKWADFNLYASVLKACTKDKALTLGKIMHDLICKSGLEHDAYLSAHLVCMYAKCGSLSTARKIFDSISEPRTSAWTAIIMGYASHGQCEKTLEVFDEMQRHRVEPNEFTFIFLLKACASLLALEEGRRVHTLISRSGFESHLLIGNTLIDMYAKCGTIDEALQVFSKMAKRDVVTWNAMLMACSKCRQGEKTLELYQEMQEDGLKPDRITFLALLNACTSLTALEQGKQIHAQIRESGLESDVVVANTLLHMYAKCGSIENAHQVFTSMSLQDVVSCNVMIAAYAKRGLGRKALNIFSEMLRKGMQPDSVTYVALLNACSVLMDLVQGKYVHRLIESSGFPSNVYVGNALIDMYAKCGSAGDARKVFNQMLTKNIVSWNTMILGYAKNGQGILALEMFQKMQTTGIKPNRGTLAGILKACSSLLSLEQGKWYHLLILQSGLGSNLLMGNALVEMYARCGSLKDAGDVFEKMRVRNVDTWNTMIGAYMTNGHLSMAQELFYQMKSEGMQPDKVTFILLNSCGKVAFQESDNTTHYNSTIYQASL